MSVVEPEQPATHRPRRAVSSLGNLRIGEVLGTSVSIWLVRLPVFLLLTAVLYLPFAGLQLWLDAHRPDIVESAGYVFAATVASMLLSLVVTGVVVHAVFRRLRGKPVAFTDSLVHALRRFPSIVAIGLRISLILAAVFLAAIALSTVLPLLSLGFMTVAGVLAVFLYTAWWVAIPVCVVERAGSRASIVRSFRLTRGSRLAIFLLLVVSTAFALAILLLGMLAGELVEAGRAFEYGAEFLAVSFQAVLTAVGYHELRLNVEGLGAEELAAIFD